MFSSGTPACQHDLPPSRVNMSRPRQTRSEALEDGAVIRGEMPSLTRRLLTADDTAQNLRGVPLFKAEPWINTDVLATQLHNWSTSGLQWSVGPGEPGFREELSWPARLRPLTAVDAENEEVELAGECLRTRSRDPQRPMTLKDWHLLPTRTRVSETGDACVQQVDQRRQRRVRAAGRGSVRTPTSHRTPSALPQESLKLPPLINSLWSSEQGTDVAASLKHKSVTRKTEAIDDLLSDSLLTNVRLSPANPSAPRGRVLTKPSEEYLESLTAGRRGLDSTTLRRRLGKLARTAPDSVHRSHVRVGGLEKDIAFPARDLMVCTVWQECVQEISASSVQATA